MPPAFTGGLLFRVTQPEPDINGNYKTIVDGWDNPLFPLPAGTYRVQVSFNNNVYEALFEVKAGEINKLEVLLQ